MSRYLCDEVLFQKLVEGLEKGYRVALAIVVDKKGSGPRGVGAKIVVYENGEVYGSLGGGSFEESVVEQSLNALRDGKSRILKYSFTGVGMEDAIDTGLICGGVLTVYIDVVKPSPRVFIVGAGRIGKPLADLFHMLGYHVYIADPLKELASKELFPYARELYSGSPEDMARFIIDRAGERDLVFIVHGEVSVDYTILKKLLLESKVGYIGLLGSRRKVAEFLRRLREEGVRKDVIVGKLHAPVGIDIGAETPEEIAVSIVAEAISWVKNMYRKGYNTLSIVDKVVESK